MNITPSLSLAVLAGASLLAMEIGQARAEGEDQGQACAAIATTSWPDTQDHEQRHGAGQYRASIYAGRRRPPARPLQGAWCDRGPSERHSRQHARYRLRAASARRVERPLLLPGRW